MRRLDEQEKNNYAEKENLIQRKRNKQRCREIKQVICRNNLMLPKDEKQGMIFKDLQSRLYKPSSHTLHKIRNILR